MNLRKKILRRLELFIRSIPAITRALFIEPRKHPWRLILDILVLPSDKRYQRTLKYIGRYYKIKKLLDSKNQFVINFREMNIIVNSSLINNKRKLVGLFGIYLDLIYPYSVKFPIPILTPEGPYENDSVFLELGDVVVDAGANVGIFTFWAAKKVGENGRVFAFEPFQEVNKILSDSLEYNEYQGKNIEVVPCALGEDNGDLTLNYQNDDLGGSKIGKKANLVKVSQIRLDDFIEKKGIDRVDFIKMDIEGMEREALKGASKTIAKFKPKLAVCIYHLPDDPVIISEIIKTTCPDYQIVKTDTKLYAWCSK